MSECKVLAAVTHQNIRTGANNLGRSLRMIVRSDVSNTIVIGP
jgi:hypothetical protein